MRPIKQISRNCKTRITDALSRLLLRSGHFRRTVLRRLFSDHLAPGSLAYVTFPDHVMIVDPRDHMIAFHLARGDTWQRDEFNRAIEITTRAGALKPDGWCIDVGANIGTQSLYALLSGRFRGVIAIEPEPHNVKLLQRNIELNGFTARTFIIEAAASGTSGTAELTRDAENFGGHSLERDMPHSRGDRIAVQTRRIDDILTSLNIPPEEVSLVMIDVEGHEIEVLKGMEKLRQAGVPLVTEVTCAVHGQQGIEALRALLTPDYNHISPLQNRGATHGQPTERPLSTFDFGMRQLDVLIYNAGRPAGSST